MTSNRGSKVYEIIFHRTLRRIQELAWQIQMLLLLVSPYSTLLNTSAYRSPVFV